MRPNRVVAIAVALTGLLAAVLPVVADLDWTSTAGVIAGVASIVTIANRWLIGWQQQEGAAAQAGLDLSVNAALVEKQQELARASVPRVRVPR